LPKSHCSPTLITPFLHSDVDIVGEDETERVGVVDWVIDDVAEEPTDCDAVADDVIDGVELTEMVGVGEAPAVPEAVAVGVTEGVAEIVGVVEGEAVT